MLISKILDPGGKLELYLKLRPETCKKEPLKLFGRPYILYYNALSKNLPGTALTTKASFMMFETYEYLSGPAGNIQSFLILPEFAKAISVSM